MPGWPPSAIVRDLATAAFAADPPRLAVVAVAGQGAADHDDQTGVGIDDDLVVGGGPVVFGLFGDRVVAGGDEGAVHDEHHALAEPSTEPERERWPEVVDDAVGRGLGDPEQPRESAHRQARAPLRGDQQHPVLQRRLSRTSPTPQPHQPRRDHSTAVVDRGLQPAPLPPARQRRHQRSGRHCRPSANGSGRVRTRYTVSRENTRRFSSARASGGNCRRTSSNTSRACLTSSKEQSRHEHSASCG